jgi:gliding motility-associated protein GldL
MKNLEKYVNVIASFGAAVVIVGALFKILHWEGANQMLMIGMFTEAAIFILYGMLYIGMKPSKDYDWEKVYPELADGAAAPRGQQGVGLTAKMDEMMAQAKISPDIFDNLGKGMRSLTDSVSKIGQLTDATVATNDYAKNARTAAVAMGEMNKSYGVTMTALNEMATASQDAKEYRVQFAEVTKKMGALNAIYEMELQDTQKHLKAMNAFYGNLSSAMESMAAAGKDTQQIKQEMTKLTNNLNALNNVYGNMLSAMKG